MCADGSKAASGGTLPSLSSQMNSNPSSLPTIPMPPGLEVGYDTAGDYSSAGWNVAGVKGSPRLGIGFSTEDNDTFYTYNLRQAFQGTPLTTAVNNVYAQSAIHNTMNLSGSYALVKEPGVFLPVGGLSLVYDESTQYVNIGYGASLSSSFFSLGGSYVPLRGKTSRGILESSTLQWSVGLKLGRLSLDYSQLDYRTKDSRLQNLTLFSKSANYYSLAYGYKSLSGTVSMRQTYNVYGEKVHRELVALRWQATQNLGLSYKMNYLVGAHSVAMQVFF